MSDILVDGEAIALDKEGFLLDLQDWSESVAAALAEREGIILTPAHLEVIQALRNFYQTYQLSPAMRPLVKYVGQPLFAPLISRQSGKVWRQARGLAQARQLPLTH